MEQYLEARKVEEKEKVLALWLQPDSDKGRQDSLREYKRFKAELNEFKKTKEICWGIKPVSDKKRDEESKIIPECDQFTQENVPVLKGFLVKVKNIFLFGCGGKNDNLTSKW